MGLLLEAPVRTEDTYLEECNQVWLHLSIDFTFNG